MAGLPTHRVENSPSTPSSTASTSASSSSDGTSKPPTSSSHPSTHLEFSVWFSRGAGLCLSVDISPSSYSTMCRNFLRIVRPKVRWLPLDESQWFHKAVCVQPALLDDCAYEFALRQFLQRGSGRWSGRKLLLQIHYTQAGGITGHVMLLCMLAHVHHGARKDPAAEL